MKNSREDHSKLADLIESLKEELEADPEHVKHELADLLAGADRDLSRLRESDAHDDDVVKHFTTRVRDSVATFRTEHPKVSRIALELMDHLNHMGI